MKSYDVMAALEAEILRQFPGEPVYWNRLPSGFKRPCSTIECQKVESRDANLFLVQMRVSVLITIYTAVDAYGDCDRAELTRRQDDFLSLLAGGMQVGDRFVAPPEAKAGQSPDCSEISAVFTWMDWRAEYHSPDEDAPMMERYELNGKE